MRKQFRAADLYQARAGIERMPKIRGIRSFTMFENVRRHCIVNLKVGRAPLSLRTVLRFMSTS